MWRFLSPAARLFVRDRIVRITYFVSFLSAFLVFVALLVILPRQENLILHYNVLFGIDLLGPWYQLLIAPAAEIGLVIINILVGLFLWRRDRVLSYLLGGGTLATAVMVACSSAFLLYLNR